MRSSQPVAAAMALGLLICGCSHANQSMNRPTAQPAQQQAESIDSLAEAIAQAPTAAAEADAIHRLHRYESDHGLTYTIQTFRVADNEPVSGASVGSQSVMAKITVFHGQEVVKRFTFVPKDNANLALFGA